MNGSRDPLIRFPEGDAIGDEPVGVAVRALHLDEKTGDQRCRADSSRTPAVRLLHFRPVGDDDPHIRVIVGLHQDGAVSPSLINDAVEVICEGGRR